MTKKLSNTDKSDLDLLTKEEVNLKKPHLYKVILLNDDYRTKIGDQNQKIFYPLNEKTLFTMNQNFRIFTKSLKKEEKSIITKGREFKITWG